MLCRLWHRMTGDSERQSARVAAILANNREALIAALRRPDGRVLHVCGARADILPAHDSALRRGEAFRLDDLRVGVDTAIRRVRDRQPMAWRRPAEAVHVEARA